MIHETLRCYISNENYVIEPSFIDPSQPTENLFISRSSSVIKRNVPAIPTNQQESVIVIYGIVGVVSLNQQEFLVVIADRERVGNMLGEVFRIKEVKLLPFNTAQIEEPALIKEIKHLFHVDNFYFSYKLDLTHAQQYRQQGEFDYRQVDEQFWFNRKMCERLLKQGDLGRFMLPVMTGYYQETKLTNELSLVLISRRSVGRMGTRYFSRGIDKEGHVSNQVETEQIFLSPGRVRSFVQMRGSIPIYWSQIINARYVPHLQVLDYKDSLEVFKRHIERIHNKYNGGVILMFNLINSTGKESQLAATLSKTVASSKNDFVKYEHFDFHKECKGSRYFRVGSVLLQKYFTEIKDMGYFDSKGKKQSGIIRTNCVDCLDRTNVVQSEISRMILEQWLRDDNFLQNLTDIPAISRVFNNLWADHADAISLQYSGTPALKTDFTRTGKRSMQGQYNDLFNSIVRYLKNNYWDGQKQDALDLLLYYGGGQVLEHKYTLTFYAGGSVLALAVLMILVSAISQSGNLLLWIGVLVADLYLITVFGSQFVRMPTLIHPYTNKISQISLQVDDDKLNKPKLYSTQKVQSVPTQVKEVKAQ